MGVGPKGVGWGDGVGDEGGAEGAGGDGGGGEIGGGRAGAGCGQLRVALLEFLKALSG